MGLITDSLVLKNVFANQYGSWADFKKDMFNKRIRKQDQLKPITIQYELGVPTAARRLQFVQLLQMQRTHPIKQLAKDVD